MNEKKKYKTGIVLSGGGTHGMAHTGVLKALSEAGIHSDLIVGVSAGAMVGVLYAKQISPDTILEIFKKQKIFRYPGLKIKNKGLLNGGKIIDRLLKDIKIKEFSDLDIPMIITTSNFNSGKQAVFSSGEIYPPLCGTISIPLLFNGVRIDGDFHYDGGLIDNLPVEIARKQCEKVIGVNVNPIDRIDKFDSLQDLIIRTAHIGISARIEDKAGLCDVFIEPEGIMNLPILNDSKLTETFNAGYDYARKLLSEKVIKDLF